MTCVMSGTFKQKAWITAGHEMRRPPMTCIHRWLVPAPDGRAMLPSTCKLCGAQKSFPAYETYAYQGRGPLTLKGSGPHIPPPKPRKDPATHCRKGHEMTEDNVTVESIGARTRVRCKTCRRVYQRKSNAKRRVVQG